MRDVGEGIDFFLLFIWPQRQLPAILTLTVDCNQRSLFPQVGLPHAAKIRAACMVHQVCDGGDLNQISQTEYTCKNVTRLMVCTGQFRG